MDNPIGHLDRELLSPDNMVRPSTSHPLRLPGDTFDRFRSIYGQLVIRGARNEFDNPRLFGMYSHFDFLLTNLLNFKLYTQNQIFRSPQCLSSL